MEKSKNCVWASFICIERENCDKCKKFIKTTSKKGIEVWNNYQKDIETALTPIQNKYVKKFEEL